MTDISVVLVSYNTRELLKRCLQTVSTNTDSSVSYEIIVVDNASIDGSVEMLQRDFPDVRVLPMSENLGFGPACNRAVEVSSGEYIALLNPDAELVGDTLGELLTFAADHPRAGIYGGRSINADGSLDPKSCWAAPTAWSTACWAVGLTKLFKGHPIFDPESMGEWKRDTVREVDVVTGYLLFIRREIWKELDGFDERFFLYAEDVDLCTRAKAAGYTPTIDPDAVVRHVGGASSATRAGKLVLLLKGKATYMKKHWSKPARTYGLLALLSGACLRSIGSRLAAAVSRSDKATEASQAWRTVVERRSDWVNGY